MYNSVLGYIVTLKTEKITEQKHNETGNF